MELLIYFPFFSITDDYNNLEDKNKIAKIPVEEDDKYLNDQRQPVTALKTTVNADVDSLTELKNKQSELYSIVKHQVDLYSKHEKEIKEVALALITKQHENINSLVQVFKIFVEYLIFFFWCV